MPHPVTHFEIIGKDGKKLQDFYGKLFDWHIDANNPMNYGIVDTHTPGKGIGGGIGAGDPNHAASRVTIYVEADDLPAVLKKAESLGGKTVMPPSEIPGGNVTIAMFTEPEGNLIGLAKGM